MPAQKEVDNRGLSCPQPVLNTKKALEELEAKGYDSFTVVSLVDNEVAAENVTRFAGRGGYQTERTVDGSTIKITITKKGGGSQKKEEKPAQGLQEIDDCCCVKEPGSGETVLLISSSTLGRGSEELGKILMRSFIYTLHEAETIPDRMLFINSGVYLTVEGSPVLDELKKLAERGVEIFSCGTCLDYYKLKEKLAVGSVTNMYDTVEALTKASRCITL
ncbi:MAG: sulfurtransferase-like selenium metabolism protein YedF [Firmicutes bacterium]|nr:sulfurtransferase-like selenium metabolism protein YedF [Bacillota bacterium]